ncbi:MAG: mechanosensitive ion channel family protein [Mucilaginibacter sp.]
MCKQFKTLPLLVFLVSLLSFNTTFAQSSNTKSEKSKREHERKIMHSRDSILRAINKSDTSINSLLQRIEQYSATFNEVNNSLSEGLDTVDISQQLAPVMRRIDKIGVLSNNRKSSTLRYLFVLNDNLDHIQEELKGWQSDLLDISSKLVQNQNDLMMFPKDTVLKTSPSDSTVRATFFAQRKAVWKIWRKADSTNRRALMKLSLLQDKISVSYTKTLDETDHIDSKIRNFAIKAIAGESSYIWFPDAQYNDFKPAFNGTIKLNQLLFDYFIKNHMITHLLSVLFLVIMLSWILLTRKTVLKQAQDPEAIFKEANNIYKWPVISSLLVVTAIVPYFYSNFPVVFWEVFFLIAAVLTLALVKRNYPEILYRFLVLLFALALVYSISNLFIQINNIDRYAIFVLSIISIISGYLYYKKVKKQPEGQLPCTSAILKVYIGLQLFSLLLNITGRFSLAKIIGVTAVFNIWLLVIFYIVVRIIIEALYLQFEVKKGSRSLINWMDFALIQKKFRSTLLLAALVVWCFVLLQNLNLDDWFGDWSSDFFGQSHLVGGASFTFGGFVIFIGVIWLSSIVSRIISYLFDVSAQRVTDLSTLKKKNRTSTLIIRMAVFTIGFLLAVAASNFPLDKLTIIISAFGVGIGFGLQNIVNNLVSGLILAFEKPIQIGDVVEVDGASGTMQSIGIRSSKILTGDGSEVIIPNGDLISHHVINWTLSNTNRQVAILVHTAYGVDIEKVKELLKGTLKNRDDIMATPAPGVFVNNVTEGFVEFKVLFWVADVNTVSELKSRIFVCIFQVLNENNIPLPSAQKDFNLHFPGVNPLNIPVVGDAPKDNPQDGKPESPKEGE